jgi:hypothetical protein
MFKTLWKILNCIGIYEPSYPPQLPVSTEDCNRLLFDAFVNHGLDCQFENGLTISKNGRIGARSYLYDMGCVNHTYFVQLDVVIRTYDGYVVAEACGGFGDSYGEAVFDAFHAMLAGSFHVLFNALTGESCRHCEVEDWEFENGPRRVHQSGFLERVSSPDGQEGSIFAPFRGPIIDRLKELSLSDDMHWIRVFQALSVSGPLVSEVLLDNEPCDELQDWLASQSWPNVAQYCSTRLFLIIEKKSPYAAPM